MITVPQALSIGTNALRDEYKCLVLSVYRPQ
jgi:hypothetical protein